MKKIMFNNKYGLTESVLSGDKTITRRIVNSSKYNKVKYWQPSVQMEFGLYGYTENNGWEYIAPLYKVGEIIAIAQSYSEISSQCLIDYEEREEWMNSAGWVNKMFVKSELMPYKIKITDIRIERLQDITEDDCLKEGILKDVHAKGYYLWLTNSGTIKFFKNAKDAFKMMIDGISVKGTWFNNPYVFRYEFELINIK